MSKLWAGRTSGEVSSIADDFNSSIRFDCKLYKQDITGSMAHAAMLGAQGIISQAEAGQLIDGLQGILSDLESGALEFDFGCEDIHMFVEQVLTQRLGDVGKKLHTARSRNDQVALDLRMYLKDQIDEITALVKDVLGAIVAQAENNKGVIMPGYTHLQRAQPILFSHHLMAYAMMLLRDLGRLGDCRKRMNVCPIGSCALAGTTYPTDRRFEARKLGFDDIARNSIDGVSDRDFCVELMSAVSILMMHLSRFSEEIILWASWEYKFIELSDAYTTGSSIMPQKKNPDMAELVRGKTGRVYGDLMGLLTTLKGPAPGLQQGHAGGQGSGFRRRGYGEDVPEGLRAHAFHHDRKAGDHEKGRAGRLHQRYRPCGLPREKGNAFPECLQNFRSDRGAVHCGRLRAGNAAAGNLPLLQRIVWQ